MKITFHQLIEKYGQNSVQEFIKGKSLLRWLPHQLTFLKDILKYVFRFYLYAGLAVTLIMIPSFLLYCTSSFTLSILTSVCAFFVMQKGVELYYNLEDWVKVKFVLATQSEKESDFVEWWFKEEIKKLDSEERAINQSIFQLKKFINNQYEIMSNESVTDYDKEDLYEIALEKQNKIDLLNHHLEKIKVAKLSLNNYSLSIKERRLPGEFPLGIDHHGIFLDHTKTQYEINKLYELEAEEHDLSAIGFKNFRT